LLLYFNLQGVALALGYTYTCTLVDIVPKPRRERGSQDTVYQIRHLMNMSELSNLLIKDAYSDMKQPERDLIPGRRAELKVKNLSTVYIAGKWK
jgi:hypothetical protein